MFCGSSYKPSLFQQQHIRKSLYLPTVGIVTAAPTMADEPSAPVAQATHAHECNGDSEGSPCTDLSESGASIIDGATESKCKPKHMNVRSVLVWHSNRPKAFRRLNQMDITLSISSAPSGGIVRDFNSSTIGFVK